MVSAWDGDMEDPCAFRILFCYWYVPNSILSKIGDTKVSDSLFSLGF